MTRTTTASVAALVLSLALVAAVAYIGGRFAPGAWYQALEKPLWTPPGWVFGPAWTLLYLLMAVAAWLVWRAEPTAWARAGLAAYLAQLALNGLWSWIFFGLRRPGLALVDLGVLWAMILLTTVLFWKTRPLAGGLLLPYLAWVSFAGALNFEVWRLNSA